MNAATKGGGAMNAATKGGGAMNAATKGGGAMNAAMESAAPPQAAVLRDAAPEDMEAVLDIYAHYVLSGKASFEETPPDLDGMRRRRDAVLEAGLPYLVVETPGAAGAVVGGYAYAVPYRPRSAYRYTVEDTVYVARDALGAGLGALLLGGLIERCEALGYRQMVAAIGGSDNAPSIGLHKKFGFEQAGVLKSAGFKFGQWVDSVLMQRPLGEGDAEKPE